MKPVLSERWKVFLTEVDAHLPASVELHWLGGFVLTVCYELPRPTGDVDYIAAIPQSGSENIQAQAGRHSDLARKHGLHFQHVTIADVPESYETRLIPIFAQDLVNLRLFALERRHTLCEYLVPLEKPSALRAADLVFCDSIASEQVKHPRSFAYRLIAPSSLEYVTTAMESYQKV